MSYNGSGTFNINTAGQPVVTGTVISSTAFNALTADLATGLSTAITKNGQTTVTANIPFNNFKLTGIGVATATGDALSYGQAATVTSLVASTSITDSGLTSGRVTYASTGGLLADSASLTWDGSYLTAASIKDTALTSGRVTYAGTGGLLQDSANLTFNGTTLTSAGFSGPLNGTVGATTPNTGAFTTLTATGRTTVASPTTASGRFATRSSSDANQYNCLILESYTVPNLLGIGFNGTNWCISPSYEGAGAYKDVAIFSNNSKVAEFLSTGLAVTGTLSATGTISNTGASFSGSAAAGSLTLDASGNLGLGVTPSAWANPAVYRAFEIGAKGNSIYTASGESHYTTNCYFNASGQNIYGANGYATEYQTSSGAHRWYTAPSGTAGNAITFTQAMTLDASGNLLVGTTSTSSLAASGRGLVELNGTSDSAFAMKANNTLYGYLYNSASEFRIANISANPVTFFTNNIERARINSSGNLLLGTTSAVGLFTVVASPTATARSVSYSATGGTIDYYIVNGTNTGSIATSTTTTSYVTSSDYRLKNTIAPMTGALAKVAQLKPVTYKWNADGSDGQGFIAHELAEVVPQCVTGEKDAVDAEGNPKYQGIDTSFLVATLTAAIQELKAEFDAYKSTHP